MIDASELSLGKFLAYFFGGAILIGAGAAMFGSDAPQPAPVSASVPAAKPLDDKTIALCRRIIDTAKREGIVRDNPAPNRVNVEDLTWAMMPADDKRALLGAVGCLAFGKRQNDWGTLSEYTVAYGHRSGKRLAMASSDGYEFE
jgi:hypothetical protein